MQRERGILQVRSLRSRTALSGDSQGPDKGTDSQEREEEAEPRLPTLKNLLRKDRNKNRIVRAEDTDDGHRRDGAQKYGGVSDEEKTVFDLFPYRAPRPLDLRGCVRVDEEEGEDDRREAQRVGQEAESHP